MNLNLNLLKRERLLLFGCGVIFNARIHNGFWATFCFADDGKAELVLSFRYVFFLILICTVLLFHFSCGHYAGVLVL